MIKESSVRNLTEELIKDHPNDQVLQNNLKKIESLENQSIGS